METERQEEQQAEEGEESTPRVRVRIGKGCCSECD